MRGSFLLALIFLAGCGGGPTGSRLLFDFEEENDLNRIVWKCRNLFSLSEEWSVSGKRSLRCDLAKEQYPGVQLVDFDRDWSGSDSLRIHILSEAPDTMALVIRVDDEESGQAFENRYNGRFRLAPGENRFTIPLTEIEEGPDSRLLDLSRIRTLLIFLRIWNEVHPLFIDRIELLEAES